MSYFATDLAVYVEIFFFPLYFMVWTFPIMGVSRIYNSWHLQAGGPVFMHCLVS